MFLNRKYDTTGGKKKEKGQLIQLINFFDFIYVNIWKKFPNFFQMNNILIKHSTLTKF
jgi:hypothetical protein